jgi:hypothetical protein
MSCWQSGSGTQLGGHIPTVATRLDGLELGSHLRALRALSLPFSSDLQIHACKFIISNSLKYSETD